MLSREFHAIYFRNSKKKMSIIAVDHVQLKISVLLTYQQPKTVAPEFRQQFPKKIQPV
jgi:hypothetical protein